MEVPPESSKDVKASDKAGAVLKVIAVLEAFRQPDQVFILHEVARFLQPQSSGSDIGSAPSPGFLPNDPSAFKATAEKEVSVSFQDFAMFRRECGRPESQADRALLGGLWEQEHEGDGTFLANKAHVHIKKVSGRLGNISATLNSLVKAGLAEVVDTKVTTSKRAGSSKTVKYKLFRITPNGKQRVLDLIKSEKSGGGARAGASSSPAKKKPKKSQAKPPVSAEGNPSAETA